MILSWIFVGKCVWSTIESTLYVPSIAYATKPEFLITNTWFCGSETTAAWFCDTCTTVNPLNSITVSDTMIERQFTSAPRK